MNTLVILSPSGFYNPNPHEYNSPTWLNVATDSNSDQMIAVSNSRNKFPNADTHAYLIKLVYSRIVSMLLDLSISITL
jgi:hypothetical protein